MRTKFSFAVLGSLLLLSGFQLSSLAENTNRTLLPAGHFTGASQRMILVDGNKPRYDDNLNICHIQIEADGSLKADFPDLSRPSRLREIHLQFSANQPRPKDPWADRRDTWTSRSDEKTYRAIAIPFSAELHLIRLEILQNEKLIGGAEQFYAICDAKKATQP
jgi:hypothetical protein